MAKKERKELTQERLRELLIYDPETGIFTWKVNRYRVKAGDVTGCDDGKGHKIIRIDQRNYFAGRLAWLYVFGHFPQEEIDHVSGDGMDDRIDNLREANTTQNKYNRRIAKHNTSGFKGVYLDKRKPENTKRYAAEIRVNNKKIFLGYHFTAQEASCAYLDASAKMQGEFSITKRSA